MNWLHISLLLCFFGFLKEIRPSEPFVTDFMIQPWRNITIDEVNRYVYPIGTYSYAAQLVIVFLITDYLRYKPLIVLSGLAGIALWSMLLWTTSLRHLQLVELLYGSYMATEVAYYTYIYAKVPKQHYLKTTSHTRAAILAGRFVASCLGQALVYTKSMDYRQLNYITLAAQACATGWALFLPTVRTSVYFHRPKEVATTVVKSEKLMLAVNDDNDDDDDARTRQERFAAAFRILWRQFRTSYTNRTVQLWSVWYAIGMCGYLQVIAYIQVLWTTIDSGPEVIWNGAVEALITLLGASVALLAGYMHADALNNRRRVLWSLVVLSIFEAAAILLAALTPHRNVSYIGYLVFCVLYSFTITVAR